MEKERVNVAVTFRKYRDEQERKDGPVIVNYDGSGIWNERLTEAQSKIEYYRKRKNGDFTDAFYESDLAVFESGINLMGDAITAKKKFESTMERWLEQDPNANPTILSYIYNHPVDVTDRGICKNGWKENLEMGYACMLFAVFGYGSVVLTEDMHTCWMANGSAYSYNGPVPYEKAQDVHVFFGMCKQEHFRRAGEGADDDVKI